MELGQKQQTTAPSPAESAEPSTQGRHYSYVTWGHIAPWTQLPRVKNGTRLYFPIGKLLSAAQCLLTLAQKAASSPALLQREFLPAGSSPAPLQAATSCSHRASLGACSCCFTPQRPNQPQHRGAPIRTPSHTNRLRAEDDFCWERGFRKIASPEGGKRQGQSFSADSCWHPSSGDVKIRWGCANGSPQHGHQAALNPGATRKVCVPQAQQRKEAQTHWVFCAQLCSFTPHCCSSCISQGSPKSFRQRDVNGRERREMFQQHSPWELSKWSSPGLGGFPAGLGDSGSAPAQGLGRKNDLAGEGRAQPTVMSLV